MKGTFRVSMTNKDGEQVHIGTTHEVNIDIESRPAAHDFRPLERRVIALAGSSLDNIAALSPIGIGGHVYGVLRNRRETPLWSMGSPAPQANRQMRYYTQAMAHREELVGTLRRIDAEQQAYTGTSPGKHLVQLVQQARQQCDDHAIESLLHGFIKGAYPLGSWAKAQRLIREYDEERIHVQL